MKISVLTPSYNSGKYIERAIQSVLRQNYSEYEHIIVDGGSTDQTLEILAIYPHLRWISEPDRGQSDAMNKAFTLSTGHIIVYLNADDEFESGAFSTIIKEFEENLAVDFVVGKLRIVVPPNTYFRTATDQYSDILKYWLHQFPANPVSYFYRRKVQQEIGAFPLDRYYTMDIWFILLVYQNFNIKKIDLTLGTFYFTGTNKTATGDTNKNLHREITRHLIKKDQLKLVWFFYHWVLFRYWRSGTIKTKLKKIQAAITHRLKQLL